MQYILIHGLGQNSSSWNKTISYMSKQNTITCPNLSLFLKKDDAKYTTLYHSFSEYCNSIPGKLNLCVLSLGAVIALNYAIDNPTKVKSLVLIGAQYEMPKILLEFQNIIFKLLPEVSFKNIGIIKKDFIKLTNSMISLNFSKDLKNISCPVLVLCGEKDYINKKASKNLFKNIRKSEIQFIKNAGHEVNIDAPQKLVTILNEFYHKYQL